MGNSTRTAIGQKTAIGSLYDANTDTFLSASILSRPLPAGNVLTTRSPKIETFSVDSNMFKKRFQALNIDADTAANVLSGLVHLQGSSVYLHGTSDNGTVLCGSIHYQVSSAQQKLNLTSAQAQDCFDIASLDSHNSTHVVTGINWGMHNIIEMKHYPHENDRSQETLGKFRSDLDHLRAMVESTAIPSRPGSANVPQMELQYEYTLYSDALSDNGLLLQHPDEVSKFINLVPYHISHQPDQLGWPLSYILLPLNMLHHFIPMSREIDTSSSPINREYFSKFIDLFDEFNAYAENLRRYHTHLTDNKLYVSKEHVRQVYDEMSQLEQSTQTLKTRLGQVLMEIRRGRSDASALSTLYEQTASISISDKMSALVGQEYEKIDFIRSAVDIGAVYIGYNGLSLEATIAAQEKPSCHAFLFNHEAWKNLARWNDNFAALMQLLTEPDRVIPIYVVDCDATGTHLDGDMLRICQIQNNEETIHNLVEHQKFMAENCFVRCLEKSLDTTVTKKPVDRRFVKIPCPGKDCDFTKICEWTCPNCLTPIECGFTDDYIYCDCGRAPYSDYTFRCNGERHRSEYETYDSKTLQSLLRKLDQSDYLNILILGETGVGKSTFINALVNYLSFSSLDEAKAAEKLEAVIPCSFSIQVMNRDDPSQPIEERFIRVGGRDDEADGASGASATQKTNVYSVNIGTTTYRLIDTPGIGDTRGISHDKKNMADILDTLGSYDNLHGILILLKSNNARLTITFRFCVKELLVHLHRSASKNMAFGFTNTRISNYAPGDTFRPLKTLLEEHSETGLTLSTSTTYCFDSESFRYLAAYKNGTTLPNEEDFRRSWEHSSKEANRLIEYFKTRKPHSVSSTLSLNGTRQLISELTKPMAEISKLIRDNITLMEDRKHQLKDHRLTADDLRNKLHLEKITFDSKPLQEPRTVCTKPACCDFKENGTSNNEVVTIYKTHCHPICYLDDVKQDVQADPNLIYCAAFDYNNVCIKCRHQWQEHMHVLYELEEKMVQVKDTEIERQLQANADEVILRQAGINQVERLIREYKIEHKEIQEAAARFGLFLKEHAMTPINDATLDYINMLIDNENIKINGGRQLDQNVDVNLKRLQALEEDKKAHIELVATLQENMRQPQGSEDELLDEKGVADVVARLYSLKHFGENLKSIKNSIATAHKATYRERPYRVSQNHGGYIRGARHVVRRGNQPVPPVRTLARRPSSRYMASRQRSQNNSGFANFMSHLGFR